MTEKTAKRGGRREGAGRKPKHGEAMQQYTIRLPAEWRDSLVREYGELQRAIETLVKNHLEAE